MIALIALVIRVLIALVMPSAEAAPVMVIPPMPDYAPTVITRQDCLCDDCCYEESYIQHFDEFTTLFNSYEVKRAKNGALMIRRGNSGSYKFAKKG